MFEFTFASIMASMVASGIGFVFYKYGRRMGRSIFVIFGIILFVFPCFITDLNWLVGVIAGLCALLYILVKQGF
ncbi:MAG: hypothetical protein A2901_07475 [Elusimicrobia bacterium RIFCSPLOWO2_01_FULL_54_10]|nr:MAG: hypothetical protein A2901_07475 [Elusimicrobia bacterium RIFCSPLOWO2_01_FULL_54_10]